MGVGGDELGLWDACLESNYRILYPYYTLSLNLATCALPLLYPLPPFS